ncbi:MULTISPECIES: hypothetical protein [Brucella/Ochrobactrum group]|uniref:hypothetical protein n=1 Tax=Brucella/Ochrobactrum group TaxID=2826938 RepID=UPI0016561783|nr:MULTISPECIES: hypothetical protein [Brucella/Ochrobactrum group]MBC8717325.1 hypothetical protein [Ochrobactrum sp. Marseille-Q0166]
MSNMNEILRQHALAPNLWADETRRPSAIGSLFSVQALKQAALRIADVRHGKGFHTRDLVGVLVSHAARNRRMLKPRTMMRMTLPVTADKVAVRITIEN